MDTRVLRCFAYVKIMNVYRVARLALMAEVIGGRVRGRPSLRWMESVKVALGSEGLLWRLRER